MNCDHPRRLITWTEATQHVILTDRRAGDPARRTIRHAAPVTLVCLDCGASDTFDDPDNVPSWVMRVMRDSAEARGA